MEKFIKFFFEKHPYVPVDAVSFEEKDGIVAAKIKHVGVSFAFLVDDRPVGFDVIRTPSGEFVFFDKDNYEDVAGQTTMFGRPAKAPNINPSLEMPTSRGVIGLKKTAGFVADVDRAGDLYTVTIFDDNDRVVYHKTLLPRNAVIEALKEYGLRPSEEILENGGVVSTEENLIAEINSEERPQIKAASERTAVMYKVGDFYTPPITTQTNYMVKFASGEVRPVVFKEGGTFVSDRILVLDPNLPKLHVPEPVPAKSLEKNAVYIFASSTQATEPIVVTGYKENAVFGVNQNGEEVQVYKLASDDTYGECRDGSPKVYLLYGDWKLYKLGSVIASYREKVTEFTVSKLSSNKFAFTEGNKELYFDQKGLMRYLARRGVPYSTIAGILNQLEDAKSVNVTLFKEVKHEAQSDSTSTVTDQVRAKLRKIAQLYGTLGQSPELQTLQKAQQVILQMLEVETDPQFRQVLYNTAAGMDAVMRTFAERLYMAQEQSPDGGHE